MTDPSPAEERPDIEVLTDADGAVLGYAAHSPEGVEALLASPAEERPLTDEARPSEDRLREELRPWLEHGAECGYARDTGFDADCYCGLVERLDRLAASRPAPDTRTEALDAIEAEARKLYGLPGENTAWQDGVEWTLNRVRDAITPKETPMTTHLHGDEPCDPSEEAATAGVTPYREAVDAVLAYGAEPPEYPGMVLVPSPDIAALRAARDRMEALG